MAESKEEGLFGARQGWSVRRRFGALDSYGLLLLMIISSLVVSSLTPAALENVMPMIRAIVLAATLAFALHTSDASRRAYVVCGLLVVLAIVAATVGAVWSDPTSRPREAAEGLTAFLLVTAVILTVVRRFGNHPVVTGSSILAAICIYLFAGLAFSAVYGFLAAVDTSPLFAGGAGDGTSAERIYYSFITLTTTGYGDFVPATDIARMIAVTEALLGQVYLVTIVALLVSNIGASRRR